MRKWVEFEADAVDFHINHSRCRLDRTERKRLEAYLVVLQWALEADAAIGAVVDEASEAYRASEGEMEIDGYTFARLRAVRLPEEKL